MTSIFCEDLEQKTICLLHFPFQDTLKLLKTHIMRIFHTAHAVIGNNTFIISSKKKIKTQKNLLRYKKVQIQKELGKRNFSCINSSEATEKTTRRNKPWFRQDKIRCIDDRGVKADQFHRLNSVKPSLFEFEAKTKFPADGH